jgi:hypothetical protein
VNNGILP